MLAALLTVAECAPSATQEWDLADAEDDILFLEEQEDEEDGELVNMDMEEALWEVLIPSLLSSLCPLACIGSGVCVCVCVFRFCFFFLIRADAMCFVSRSPM